MKKIKLGILVCTLLLAATVLPVAANENVEDEMRYCGLAPIIDTFEMVDVQVQNDIEGLIGQTNWYGYCAALCPGGQGPVTMPAATPCDITLIAPTTSPDFLAGACWVYPAITTPVGTYNWFCSQYVDGLWGIEPATGTMVYIGSTGVSLNGLAYDDSSGKMYGASSTDLYEVTPQTGATTFVGRFNTPPDTLMIGIACDGLGKMYGTTVNTTQIADLYEINMNNGQATSKGSTNKHLLYAQDMAMDKANGKLYQAAFFGDSTPSGMYEFDLSNGNLNRICDFPNGAEIAGFAIPYDLLCDIEIENVWGGILGPLCGNPASLKVKADIKNNGMDTDVFWDFSFSGGFTSADNSGTTHLLNTGSSTESSKIVMGVSLPFSPATVTVTATAQCGDQDVVTKNLLAVGFLWLVY
jgi:hypothetical protein